MIKKLLSIVTKLPPNANKHKIISLIKLYELFPIPEFPLNEEVVINEINHYLELCERSYPGAILLKFFDNNISEEYLNCCKENGINPLTAQGKYKFRTTPTTIFTEEFWRKAKYYKIEKDYLLSFIPMSDKEQTAVKKYTDDMDITVGALIDKIKFYHMLNNYPVPEDKIIESITGPIPEQPWIVKYIRMLKGGITESEAINILRYKEVLEKMMIEALTTLDQREWVAMEMWLQDKMPKEEIGKQFDVSGSRVHQIIAKAFRKLRHPKRSADIMYMLGLDTDINNDTSFCINQYLNDTKKELAVVKIIDILTNRPIRLICENKFVQTLFFIEPCQCFEYLKNYGIQKNDDEEPVVLPEPIKLNTPNLNSPIHELDLSVRSYNCLLRANIKTVRDIIAYTHFEGGLMKIRNLGKRCSDEIVEVLENLGFGELLPADPITGMKK